MNDDALQDDQVPGAPGWPEPSAIPGQADVSAGEPAATTAPAGAAPLPADTTTARDGPTAGVVPGSGGEGAADLAGDPLPELASVVEAVLLVADEPVPAVLLAQVVEQPLATVEQALRELSNAYASRRSGIDVRQVAGGWRLYTRADAAPWVERFLRDGQQARLTQAALETLAVVAYRQPVTRGRVSAVRGVNVDGVVRSLVSRGLLAEAGADPESGGTLYVTTPLFLQKLGLTSIDELPSLAPLLPDLDDLESDSMST